MWKESSIKVNGEVFHYWMKQYDKGSEWGIDGGRISKLMLKRNGYIACNYDRAGTLSPPTRTRSLRWSFCSTARTGKKPKFQSNGSERGCCSLYGRSHRFRWRLFFIPWRWSLREN